MEMTSIWSQNHECLKKSLLEKVNQLLRPSRRKFKIRCHLFELIYLLVPERRLDFQLSFSGPSNRKENASKVHKKSLKNYHLLYINDISKMGPISSTFIGQVKPTTRPFQEPAAERMWGEPQEFISIKHAAVPAERAKRFVLRFDSG